jgi:hypothetical protein
MRRSHLVLTSVAVAGAAVTGSAFTAGNTVPDTIAGYGEGVVTGIVVQSVEYTPWSVDGTYLAQVVFTTLDDVDQQTATLTLKTGTGVTATPLGTPYTCSMGTHDGTSMTITCATGDHPAYADFDTVGLTVQD